MAEPPKLPTSKAAQYLPAANASLLAFNGKNGQIASGYTLDSSWQNALAQRGVSKDMIASYQTAGFDASIFRNDANKQIIVAYGASKGNMVINQSPDWQTNVAARLSKAATAELSTQQYVAASALATRVQELYPGYTVTLTGWSLGGGLASFAGSFKNLPVVTFNAARNTYSGSGNNPNQVNIIVGGDPVGDPTGNTMPERAAGIGRLPGTYYTVPSVTPNDPHSLEGIIGALRQLQ